MKVLFTAAECAPFFKTGGLGDVAGALPKSIAKKGNEVRVVLPFYTTMPEQYQAQLVDLFNFNVAVGWRNAYCGVKLLEMDGIKYYFLDNKYYFDRPEVYGYYDDGERYAFFQQAVIELMERIEYIPDILHVNDYHTAFIPFLLREKYSWIKVFEHIKTVLTIHNLEFQGQYGSDVMPELFGMSTERYDDGTIRMGTAVNFMKAGILYADRVNTVSPSYASEIQTPEFGCGLDGILRMVDYKLSGILNGIDYDNFDPNNDPALVANFTAKDLSGKAKNKAALQEKFGLPVRKDVPLIGVVSRLTYQKGFQLVVQEMANLMQFDVQFVLLGTGYANFEHDFNYFAGRYPDKCSVAIDFDVDLAQQIYAGCDLFLMPSAFEPCGLSQLISMRYGTLPVVHQIGGLRDSVWAYDPLKKVGTGFGFEEFSSYWMMEQLKLAIDVYNNQPKVWKKMMKTAMKSDFSWDSASQNYLDLYHQIAQ
ncbi:glycogen synthase GlgA [Ligilactobacillus apodemi]|uniref:Glycogen synthase n=1 Tax=Ligilactobacillus apodemi DSM 16634 = JCM 16172 TaxID=1423724 RepID=A0A0R1U0W7_9LACO|nr:glycogen synthase GlgA [Ligilactobacillus apodemi]KRL86132.1 glycogen synthase [Ligilactobacillus apodemi DSM 16634 = JCM 16172]MCR1902159.1 glycogen synthase GlgA [Ligilactobacillus apodemi]